MQKEITPMKKISRNLNGSNFGYVSTCSFCICCTDSKESTGATGITVHYYTEKGTPSVYYWNALPNNISTEYPGVKMTSEGGNYYRYTFSSVSKINLQFIESDGTQGKELTRNTNSGTNEFWYKSNRWYNKQPSDTDYERTDIREDYLFAITTRFTMVTRVTMFTVGMTVRLTTLTQTQHGEVTSRVLSKS